MEQNIKIEDCEKARTALLSSLRSSALSEDLKEDIDKFEQITGEFLTNAKKYRDCAIASSGGLEVDFSKHAEILDMVTMRFQAMKLSVEYYEGLNDRVESDPILKKFTALQKTFAQDGIKQNLQSTADFSIAQRAFLGATGRSGNSGPILPQ